MKYLYIITFSSLYAQAMGIAYVTNDEKDAQRMLKKLKKKYNEFEFYFKTMRNKEVGIQFLNVKK